MARKKKDEEEPEDDVEITDKPAGKKIEKLFIKMNGFFLL